MTTPKTCPDCGAGLPADVPQGMCPNCLMKRAAPSEQGTVRSYAPTNQTIAIDLSSVVEIETRQGPVNLPWNAMSFVPGGKRYAVACLDHPGNPKEARFSEME